MSGTKEIKVDDDLYSRSIFTYGIETIQRISTLKVFIYGLRGLGIEIAKNIILNGCEEISVYDPTIVKINDLGSNFYLNENDVGKKRRDEASIEKLSELNQNIKVNFLDINIENKKEDSNEFIKLFFEKIKKYNVLVISELKSLSFITQIDNFCYENDIKFIYGFCLGLVGYIFTDFGPNHIIFDDNGEEPGKYIIKSISQDKEGLVEIDNINGTNNLNMGDGDIVKFKEVEGMTELNDPNKEFSIKLINSKSFTIGDTSNFSKYKNCGIVYQIKKPIKKEYYNFSLRSGIIWDNINDLNQTDYNKKGRVELLYLIYYVLSDFYYSNDNKLPELNNLEQAKIICDKVKKIYDDIKQSRNPVYLNMQDFDEKLVLKVIRWSAANIQPICGFFGGIIAQEIVKATGKYIPIDQWFIQDFLEIAENVKEDADKSLKNCRYDDQIAIFGNEIQDKIKKSNIFMVGAGATGCEFLKNFAMMGFCTDKNAKYVVTDNDSIEISNLSRQFLFRKKDIGKSKSLVAIKSIKEMNPEFNGDGLQLKICSETENIFNDDFWTKQDFVIFAVDSVEARAYLDSKILLYEKPAIDSGTKGPEARSMVIIPKETLTYKDRMPSKKEIHIPNCTLRIFPSLFQHCVEWSKDKFVSYFGDIISNVKLFFSDFNSFKEKMLKVGGPMFVLENIKEVKVFIDIIITKDLKKTCEYAIEQFTHNFEHAIQQIIINYPKDYKDSKGVNFWNSSRRFPHPIKFDPDDELCLEYVYKFVFILSHALGIEYDKNELNKNKIKKISSDIKIPEFVKKYEIIVSYEDGDKKNKSKEKNKNLENKMDIEEQNKAQMELDNLLNELNSIKRENYNSKIINPEIFEKDHDQNGHIDFIHAGAILHARNYIIDEYDRNKTKEIAGQIIPAILTTTASIAGVASMQLYTLFQTTDRKFFRNAYLKLSSNKYNFLEPSPPIKNIDKEYDPKILKPLKYIPEKFCSWDYIKIESPMTIKQLKDKIKNEYKVEIDYIIFGENFFCNLIDDNMELKIEEIYEQVTNNRIDKNKRFIIFETLIKDLPEAYIEKKIYKDVAVVMPPFKYYLNKLYI